MADKLIGLGNGQYVSSGLHALDRGHVYVECDPKCLPEGERWLLNKSALNQLTSWVTAPVDTRPMPKSHWPTTTS